MKWRTDTVQAIRSDNRSRTFEMEFNNPDSHQPSASVLTYEVPDPEGKQRCASDCPVCGGAE